MRGTGVVERNERLIKEPHLSQDVSHCWNSSSSSSLIKVLVKFRDFADGDSCLALLNSLSVLRPPQTSKA